MNVLSLVKGTSQDFQLSITNLDGTAVTTFNSSIPIYSRIWRGEGQPTLLSLPFLIGGPNTGVTGTSWTTATSGLFQVSLNDADTATLETGQYRIQSLVTQGTPARNYAVFDGFFNLTGAPGTDTTRSTYATYADMIRAAPWIQNLQTETDLEGFATERANAREWLDNLIVHNYRGASVGRFETHSMAAFMFGYSGQRRTVILSQWLKDLLIGDMTLSGGVYQGPPGGALIVTAQTKRIVTYRAIAEVAMGMLGKGGDYAAWGVQFRNAANSECVSYTAELDTNNDGKAEIAIPFATSAVLYT